MQNNSSQHTDLLHVSTKHGVILGYPQERQDEYVHSYIRQQQQNVQYYYTYIFYS